MSILKFPNKIQYIHNKDFKTIIIKVMFPFDNTLENIALNAMLPPMLNYMTKNYPNEEDLVLEKKKRYILSCSIYRNTIGECGSLCYEFTIPDKTCLKENYFDKQFELMEEIIYNPKITNNKFDELDYERELKNTKLGLDSVDKKMRAYQHTKLINLVDDEGYLSLSLYNNKEKLDEVNTSNLYDYYKDVISHTPFIFVFGDLDEDEFNKLFNKYIIKSKDKEIIGDYRYDYFLTSYKDKYSYYHENSDFKDSALSVVYKIKDFNEDDFKYLFLVRGILDSLSTRVLDNKLRGEHDLVYGSRCNIYKRYGLLEITTYINKNNKDLVFEKILEVMEDIKNEDFIAPLLDNVIDGERISLLKRLDQKYVIFDDYILNYLGLEIDRDLLYKMFLKVKAKDIVNFLDRFIIDTVYFLEEGDNND